MLKSELEVRWSSSSATLQRFGRSARAALGRLIAPVALAAFGFATAAARAAEPVPLMSFFRHAAVQEAVLSPDGSHVAALMAGGPGNRVRLLMIDLNDMKASKLLAAFSDADIRDVRWVNDRRVVYSLVDQQRAGGDQPGNEGLFSIDALGIGNQRRLIKSQWQIEELTALDRELPANNWLFETLRDGTDDVIVAENSYNSSWQQTGVALLRLNTATGQTRRVVSDTPGDVFGWVVDPQGRPRVAVTARGGMSQLYWKPTAEAVGWTLVRSDPTYVNDAPGTYRLDADNKLIATAHVDGSDTRSLVRIDLTGGDKVEPLLSLKGFDFEGSLRFDPQGRLLGAQYVTDARGTHWFDPALQAVQDKLDKLLPATSNLIDCGDCGKLSRVLVYAFSDRQPGSYYLYDVAGSKLELLAASRPWIDAKTMASRDFQRFKARDGMEIPVYVTRPRGATGASPTVVLVHGGPWVRGGEWAWDAESQFLASRGYVVIEPAFRGSTGFGSKLFRAGFKQWGLAMQDDIADAARWAVAQGWANPKRMAIAGASYGGYATLMGLIRDPDPFRCGFEWVGVSDIDLLYSIHWSDSGEMYKQYGLPVLVGDRQKDAAQLAATSPLKQAARLKQPLLMAYGAQDVRVPPQHGTAMRNALSATNPNVEFVIYTGEAHGWLIESTSVDFWGRVERFLAKNLAPAP